MPFIGKEADEPGSADGFGARSADVTPAPRARPAATPAALFPARPSNLPPRAGKDTSGPLADATPEAHPASARSHAGASKTGK